MMICVGRRKTRSAQRIAFNRRLILASGDVDGGFNESHSHNEKAESDCGVGLLVHIT